MAENTRRFSGSIIAPKGVEALARELEVLGWNAGWRRNTVNRADKHLEIYGETLSLSSGPQRGGNELVLVHGELATQTPGGEEALEKLANDLEGLGIRYSLELYDEAGIHVVRQFGDPTIGEDLITAARELLEEQESARQQSGCALVFIALAILGLGLL